MTMYLTGYQVDLVTRIMVTLAEPHGELEIRARVGRLMLDLLSAQHYASYVWDDGRQCFDRGVHINMEPANLAQYERYFQYHDPITPVLQRHDRAVRVTDVMPQRDLLRTEFFNDFLARDGLHWGVNLYAWCDGHNIGDMRIWRDRRRENFTRDELELLDLVRPAFVAALRRSRGAHAGADRPPAVREAASAAGREHLLSARERDVARLAVHGLPDKEIARRLGISLATVRTHFDHAFRKLDVCNRTALVQKLNA
jgi:DNA-binding CsgD family transcriptional regulator